MRDRGNGATKRGSSGKSSSVAEKPRRKSLIGKAMKEIKRNSRDYADEDGNEVYDLDDDAGAFGLWSGEKEKRGARRRQEKGKGRQAFDEQDDDDAAYGDRVRYGGQDEEDSE